MSANWGAMESRNGECVRDPTVGVDHVARHSAVIYAGDRVTLKRDGGEFCIILLVDGVELWQHSPMRLLAVTMIQQTKSNALVIR